jgi:outer membrane immunogenic protein
MKKVFLLAAVSQCALIACSGADAADLPMKARPMLAPPVYSWTGCYAGAHLGFGWARQEVTASNYSYGPGGTTIAATNALESSGGVYGGQAGCNYQFAGNWVLGIQGDIAGTNIRGNVEDPYDYFPTGSSTRGSLGAKIDWIASVTGRLGFTAWDNRALFYAKGGGAWDRSRWDFSRSSYCRDYNACIVNQNPDNTRSGWTVGAGTEWVISPVWSNWTAFVEYNYYDFGSNRSLTLAGLTPDPRNYLSPGKDEVQTVKIGVNYKLFNY